MNVTGLKHKWVVYEQVKGNCEIKVMLLAATSQLALKIFFKQIFFFYICQRKKITAKWEKIVKQNQRRH